MSKTEINDMLDLPKREFIKRCKQYIDEERGGKLFEISDPGKCMNHVVKTLSRVTGYLSTVESWNEAKQQEFKDRQRYDL